MSLGFILSSTYSGFSLTFLYISFSSFVIISAGELRAFGFPNQESQVELDFGDLKAFQAVLQVAKGTIESFLMASAGVRSGITSLAHRPISLASRIVSLTVKSAVITLILCRGSPGQSQPSVPY